MKIATRPVTLQSNIPANQTQAFRINFDATMAYALMSGIAKDKISYPIREVSTNAYDANPSHPFDVQLPTRMDPTFKVRDYGPGLSHQQILDVYTTFGGSLKRDDDSQVGGLGYGSKSPFAYLISRTDGGASFQVTSIHRPHPDPASTPIKTIYLMALDETGMPTVTTLTTAPTTEHTGIEVSFTVDKADISEFHNSAAQIYKFFPTTPTITPNNIIDPALPDPIESNPQNNWSLYDSPTTTFYGPHVRMGCVAYPIDLGRLSSPYDTHNWPFRYSPILFEAPIGSLSFTTSREELGYNARTIKTITSLLSKFVDDYTLKIQAKIDPATTYLEACGIYTELTSTYPVKHLNLRYKSHQLVDEHTFLLAHAKLQLVTPDDLPYLSTFTPSGLPERRRSRPTTTTRATLPAASLKDVRTVVYSSKPKKPFQVHRLRQYFSDPDNSRPFIWIKPSLDIHTALTLFNLDDLELIDIETLPPFDFQSSQSPQSTSTSSTTKRSKTVKSTLYLHEHSYTPQKDLLDYGPDNTEPCVYVTVNGSSYRRKFSRRTYKINSTTPSFSHYDIFHAVNLIKENIADDSAIKPLDHIWLFDAEANRPLPPNAIKFGDYFTTLIQPLIDQSILLQLQTMKKTQLSDYSWAKFVHLHPALDHSLVPQQLINICATVVANRNKEAPIPDGMDSLYRTYSQINPVSDADPNHNHQQSLEDTLSQGLNQLYAKYPLLELILDSHSTYSTDNEAVRKLHHYFSILNEATPTPTPTA
jgi:hypothetical protein